MSEITLALPTPRLKSSFQPGVTDPVWPGGAPVGVDPTIYDSVYSGRIERQRYLHLVTADVTVGSCEKLCELLQSLSTFASHEMNRTPHSIDHRAYDPQIRSPRVTVTVGYGATLFTTRQGDDRFGFANAKPTWLKILPAIEGDDPSFSSRAAATDLIFLLASDDYYVNEYLYGLIYYGNVHPGIRVQSVERGYARPDSREPSGFEDGSSNPRDTVPNSLMHRFVYIKEGDDEPQWCVNGTYLAFRKIQRRLKDFFKLDRIQQETIIGSDKTSGDPIADMPVCCHKFKMNPRREHPDLFGIMDEDRQILRRPYFFDDGVDPGKQELRGLHHLSFARNLGVQYEWRIQMWQMNDSFPNQHSGVDALYGRVGGACNVGGGYFFVPGVQDERLRSPIAEPK
jgi:deferrochelatase/peroxidase EfeB